MAYLMAQTLQPNYEENLFAGEAALAAAAAVGMNSADESLPYSTAELNAPEYSTDDFRMFSFKVARCSKRYVHDWRACPFAHPTENARRRDPRLHKYLPVPCPEYKRGICFRGDACPYSHGVYECWLHPAKYRTQLCKEGPHCRRPVCFFAHSVLDLRQPTHVWDGNNYEPQTAAAALIQAAAAGAQPSAATCRSGSKSSFLQQLAAQQSAAAEEALNNSGSIATAGSEESLAAAANAAASGSCSGGPSSPHGSLGAAEARSGSPTGAGVIAAQALASPTLPPGSWSPSAAPALLAERAISGALTGDASPATPSRAASGDIPMRPSAEASAAAALAASPADLSALASLVAMAQPQQQPAAAAPPPHGLPRHSIDVGALAASSSRGSLAGAASQSPVAPRMSFDLPHAGSGAGASPQTHHRMSLDSLMQTRAAPGAQGAPWPPPANNFGALQDLQSGSAAPRMSNAVARKLGLAPQRTANEARLAKLRTGSGGLATPPRNSLDGLLQALHAGGRASLEQQMVNQQMLAAAGLAQMNNASAMSGGYMGPFSAAPGAYMGADPNMGINPALLTVVAAQMGGGVPAPMPGAQGMPPQNAAAMAALVDSINGWSLNGGVPQQPGAYAGGHHMQHRPSYDGPLPQHAAAAAAYMAHQGPPTSAPFYLPSELETMMNNGELVHPVGVGRGRE